MKNPKPTTPKLAGLLLKSCTGNRSLGWDVLPPGSPSYVFNDTNYAGYGDFGNWPVGGEPPTSGDWYAGKEFDRFFKDEADWAHDFPADFNVVDVLDNFTTEYPDWAGQGFEIAGFVWWQGDKDRYDLAYATRYEQNLVRLIDSLRSYYGNRYPGKIANNAPFVLATLGQTALDSTNEAETTSGRSISHSGMPPVPARMELPSHCPPSRTLRQPAPPP